MNQGFRGWPVETEMPDSRIVVHRSPLPDAREERVHHHQFLDFPRKLCGVGVRHHEADVVSDEQDDRWTMSTGRVTQLHSVDFRAA